MKNKTALRNYAKNLRKTLDIVKISKALTSKIKNCTEYQNAENVMLFYPMKYEINLLDLLEDDKKFYLPKVDGEKLLVCPYNKNEKLEKSNLNIYEPCSNSVCESCLDLVIVPALMADKEGFRLGYGGGFYDRFLARIKVFKLCVVPKEFFVENLPHDEFDICMDKIFIN